MSIAPTLPEVSPKTITLGYQLAEYVEASKNHRFVSTNVGYRVNYILNRYRRPPEEAQPAVASQRQTSRSASAAASEPRYPHLWATSDSAVRQAIRLFTTETNRLEDHSDYQWFCLRYAPPSTGNTPEPQLQIDRQQADRQRQRSDTGITEEVTRSDLSAPPPSTNQTSASPPGSPKQSNMANQVDPETQRLIDAAINSYLLRHPPQTGPEGPPGPQGPEGPAGAASAGGGNGAERFIPGDVGFFDPFYDGKSSDTGAAIEHSGKDTFFRDVHVFLDRIKDVSRTRGPELVRRNLQLCLRGSALEWYTTELTDGEKRLTLYGEEIEEWSTLLLARFKQPRSTGMAVILKERYSMSDAARQREPREYAQTILRAAKTAELGDTADHLLVIWNGLELEFQRDIDEPTKQTSLNTFLQSLDKRKHQWWAYASRSRPQQQQQAGKSREQPRSGQNVNRGYQPYQPNFQRQPFQPWYNNWQGNSGPQYQRPYSYQGQNNAYQSNYQNRNQPPNVNVQARLPQPPNRLQITAGPSGSGSNNPPPNNNRQPFTPISNNAQNQNRPGQSNWGPRYQPREQRAYQATVSDENEADKDNSLAYNAYEDQNPDGGSETPFIDYGSSTFDYSGTSEYNERHDNDYDAGAETHFVNPTAPLAKTPHVCDRCNEAFTSRNKLFDHLRTTCWKVPSTTDLTATTDSLHASATEPDPDIELRVIKSSAKTVSGTGYAFKNWHYAVVQLYWEALCKSPTEVCADSGCTMSMIDRKYLQTTPASSVTIKKLPSTIPIRGLGNRIQHSDEFAVFTFYFKGQNAVAAITRELHIVDDLRARVLIGTDILTPERIDLKFSVQQMVIGSCENLAIPFSSHSRQQPNIKRTIRTKGSTVLVPGATTNVPITYHGQLPDDRDFLFEPQLNQDLGLDGGVFAHIVDANMSFVQVRNGTGAPIALPRRARLGTVVEYNQEGCFLAEAVDPVMATTGWRNWKGKVAKFAKAAVLATALLSNVPSGPTAAPTDSVAPSSVPSVAIDPNLEHVLPNGATVYGSPTAANRLAEVIDQYQDVFVDSGTTVDLPEQEWMPINLKPGAEVKPSRVYPLSQKDKDEVDKVFDQMQTQGKMSYVTQPTKFSYPVFVVWRTLPNGTRKGRVVVDIRGLNKITESDTYPLPLQSDVIASVAGYRYITVVDAVGWFHQFRVRKKDRHKLTVVSHRGQEQSAVALMGYKGSPPYVQRQTDQMLRPYKNFAKAYIDDIIVFSQTLNEHIDHLRQIFDLFRAKRVSLSPGKSFIGYPSVRLLGQRVDALGMTTAEDKIAAISALKFPDSLRDLEIFLGMTGWLRPGVPRYAQRSEPLQKRKTLLTKAVSTKGTRRKSQATKLLYDATSAEQEAFDDLKKAFASPTFLTHFDPSLRLFVDLDASKAFGFAAMVYHVIDGKVQPIMFLSKCLNDAEKNYWPTELEVAGVVWLVKKIRHMIESTKQPPTVIYTDHSAAIPISRQTTLSSTSTDKLNLRLVRASQYLSAFEIELRHKSGKSNVVPDALSRLAQDTEMDNDAGGEGILDVLYGTADQPFDTHFMPAIPDVVGEVYHTTLVEMSDDFKRRLREAYTTDDTFKRILELLKVPATSQSTATSDAAAPAPATTAPTATAPEANPADVDEDSEPTEHHLPGIRFRLRDGLLYYTSISGTGKDRLCIPKAMEQEVFKQAHDLSSHGGFHRTFDRISASCYVRRLSSKLRRYIQHCPACQLNQTVRHPPYGSLVPIDSPSIPFHTITMDFVLGLPVTPEGMNTLLTITDKFTKRVLLIPGKDTYSAIDWANLVLTALMSHDWGVPRSIISDRDSKFMSSFWRAIFEKLGTEILASTAWHPQTDGQSERTNQTIEIALRYHITERPDDDWTEALPWIQSIHNNSMTSTGFAPNELAYGFKVNDTVGMLSDLPPEDWDRMRLIKREEAEQAMSFASILTKLRYDKKHKAVDLKVGDEAYLKLHHGYSLPGANKKLSQQRAGPFKIIQKVGHLAYGLKLPPTMTIHPVISVAQLEPVPRGPDPYNRPRPDHPPPVQMEGLGDAPAYEIERLVDRRVTANGTLEYFVKWKGYGLHHGWWYKLRDLQDSLELVQQYDNQHPFPTRQSRRQRGRAPEPAPPVPNVPTAQRFLGVMIPQRNR